MWIEMKLRPDYRGNLCGVEDGCGLNLRVRQHPKPHYGGGDITGLHACNVAEPVALHIERVPPVPAEGGPLPANDAESRLAHPAPHRRPWVSSLRPTAR